MKNVPVLDREHLRGMTDGDLQFERELLATYRASAQNLLARLSTAVDTGDPEQIIREAHALKGASLNVGATAMGQCAGAIEEAARAGDLTAAAASAQRLDTEAAALWAALDRMPTER